MVIEEHTFIKLLSWNAYVLDVMRSKTGRVVVEVYYAKDVARSNPSELIDPSKWPIEPSAAQAFIDEVMAIRKGQDELLEKICTAHTVK